MKQVERELGKQESRNKPRLARAALQARRVFVVAAMLGAAFEAGSCRDSESGANAEGSPVVPSQVELAATYSTLTDFIIEVRKDAGWKKFRAEKQATLTPGDNRLRIEATSDDPVIILPGSDLVASVKRFMVELVIESPAETQAQLYYLTKGQTKYTERHSQIAPLKPGRNIIYFQVEDPNLIGPLRLDPGATAGVYVISSMNVMALPP